MNFLSLIRNTTIAVTIVVSLAGCDRSPSAEKKILGTWETTSEEEPATFVFTPNNQLFFIEGDDSAVASGYQLNTKTKPMQLNISDGQENALVILSL